MDLPMADARLAVGIDGPRERGREPVQGYGREDRVEGWVGVGPGEEFFGDPGEETEGGGAEDVPDCCGTGVVFERVGAAG